MEQHRWLHGTLTDILAYMQENKLKRSSDSLADALSVVADEVQITTHDNVVEMKTRVPKVS